MRGSYSPSFASETSGFAQPGPLEDKIPGYPELDELRAQVKDLRDELSALQRLLATAAYDAVARGHVFEAGLLSALGPDLYARCKGGLPRD
jgi:hypothetical protein